MLIGSAGAIVGSLLMFLQGGFYLHEAWYTIMAGGGAAERQVTGPVLEAVDAFLFGIVLVIFAYGIAIGFVFTLPEGYGKRLPNWMKVEGVGQLKATLAEVVIVLIVIFARIVVGVNGHLECVDAGATRLDPVDLDRAPHDRAWGREESEGGGCCPLGGIAPIRMEKD
jgi:uncharacterized membrane protein YqhA